jgi:DNA-directed RNA polymerase specialized sigma24 family protein
MVELEGLGVQAVASLLGISAVTVRWHLSRGRRELAGALQAYMGGSDERKK